jgi:group I intron endonuclease
MKTGIIYMYTSPSGKSYIGQTWYPDKRKKQHKDARSKSYFHSAIKKYGFENFKYEILHENIQNQIELDLLESCEIENKKTLHPYGYNLMITGRGGLLTEEHKNRIKKAHLALELKMPEYTKQCLIKANKGRKLPREQVAKAANKNRGKKRTEEFKINQSIKQKGIKRGPLSEEHKNKLRGRKMPVWQIELLRNINKNRKIKEEQKNIIRECNKNRVWKEDSKQKIILKLSKNVLCIETGIIYLNCKEAAIKNGFKHSSAISRCALGKTETSYGFHWEYVK